ncbi:hypothetical protein [Natrinema sp. J7-2]|uniref:hypothetical protein n=1 Tax=Natrinema sp. (strain J7-2) TaxID=406552 RepID=UPI00026D4FAA|nr:hypothetical protein NJ7G_2116 [Natrinema sp. J7-2]
MYIAIGGHSEDVMSRHETRRQLLAKTGTLGLALMAGCMGNGSTGTDGTSDGMNRSETDGTGDVTDPGDAPRTRIDRFSDAAGTLMVRSDANELPEPNEPIDFDQKPFVTEGFGPDGEMVTYYNFDVQPTTPAPIYALFREGEETPLEDQRNIIDVIPGDEGYNDFWHVHEVTVPADYEANTATSVQDLQDGGYDITATDVLKNCPVVPDGSTASLRHGEGDTGLVEGWYEGQIVSYFLFEETPLTVTDGSVPVSPIYVTFNENPGEDGGGPPSGFVTEDGGDRTHNVVATVPNDDGYSPLWSINVYDNADFASVSDLESATAATLLESDVATVNCPVVSVGTP